MEVVLYAGLVNWLATWIIVESKLFEGVREWVQKKAGEESKLAYLTTCHLCAGTWVGLALSTVLTGPLAPTTALSMLNAVLTVLLNGLLFKSVGHLLLEVATFARHSVAIREQQVELTKLRVTYRAYGCE